MFIEDLIQRISNTGKYLFASPYVDLRANPHDTTILSSFGEQVDRGNALTEKQAGLALKLLDKYRGQIRGYVPTIDDILETPVWKTPFRILPKFKKIAVEPVAGVRSLTVEFPYDNDLVDSLRKTNSELDVRHKGAWDGSLKKWVFSLNETNIIRLGDMFLVQPGFTSDEDFASLYLEINNIRENIEQHLPMLTLADNQFNIVNAHKNVPQPNTTNLVEALFFARTYGINTWDDEVQKLIDEQLNPVVKHLVSANTSNDQVWVNSETHSISDFEPVLKHNGPTMIIVPGGSELEQVRKWTDFAITAGFNTEDISVMFRLPNEHAIFNQYVKDAGLNNPVAENTKVVFVSTKITKPLIKSGVKFNTVINLGYYNYMHFTMSAAVENTRNLVYYSMKEPTERRRWQQLK